MQTSISRHALQIAQQETAEALAGRIVFNGYTPMDIDTSRLTQEQCEEWDNYLHTTDSEAPSAAAMGNVELSFCNDEGEQQQTRLAEAISSYGFTVRAGGDRVYRWPFNAELLTSQEAQEKAAMLQGRLQAPAHIEVVEIYPVEDNGMVFNEDGELYRVRQYAPDANGDVNNCWVVCTLHVYDNEDKQGKPKTWHGNVDILIQDFDLTVNAD